MRAVALVATLVVALLAGGAGVPAQAAAQPVQLSYDGRNWAPDLTRPIFDPAVRWVPGDSRSASFWVRNAGATTGALAVTAHVNDPTGLVAEDAVALRMRTEGGTWTAVVPGASASLGRLADGARTKVEVTASFAWPSGNDTMRRTLDFSLDVRLSGSTAGTGDHGTGGHTTGNGGGLLPNTGNPVTWWLCLLAALSLGGGTALVVRSKRREHR